MNNKNINDLCFCLSLRKPGRLITAIYDQALSHLDIRSTQFSMLVALHYSTRRTLTALSQDLCMDRTTLCRNINGLKTRGLIIARESQDKRSKEYGLTAAGNEMMLAASVEWSKIQAEIKHRIGEEWFKSLDTLTRKLSCFGEHLL